MSQSTPTLPSHTISSISVGNEAKAGHTHSHSLTHTLTNPLTHNACINTLTHTQTHNERHTIILTCAHIHQLIHTHTQTYIQIHKRTHTPNPMNLHTYLPDVDNQDENPQVRTPRSHPHKNVTVLPHYLFFSFSLSLSRTSQI